MARINVFGGRTIGRPLGQCNGFAGPQRLTCDMKPRLSIAFCVLCAVLVACDATAPSRTTSNLSGQWTGIRGRGHLFSSVSRKSSVSRLLLSNTPLTAVPDPRVFLICIWRSFRELPVDHRSTVVTTNPARQVPQDRTEIGGYFRYSHVSTRFSLFFGLFELRSWWWCMGGYQTLIARLVAVG